jgi:anti-sigma B factor antagonist
MDDGAEALAGHDGETGAQLFLQTKEIADRTVVTAVGEIDLSTSPRLRACLADLSGIVVVDLGGVTFLDSSGLGVLIGAWKRLREGSGDLRLRALRNNVRQVFVATGLTDMVT